MDETEPIGWSKNIFLKWSDFKAEHNSSIFEDSHSEIKFRFTWTVNSDTKNKEIVFLIERLTVFFPYHLAYAIYSLAFGKKIFTYRIRFWFTINLR